MENTGYALGYMPRPDMSLTDMLEAVLRMKEESSREKDGAAEIREALNKACLIPYGTMPEAYDKLAMGDWPEQLGQEPEEWGKMSWVEKSETVKPAMESIKKACGAKMLERYRCTVRLGMTDAQFEDWWESVGRKESSDKWSVDPIWLMLIMTLLSKGF